MRNKMMKTMRNSLWTAGMLALGLLAGCGAEYTQGMLGTNTTDVDRIRNDSTLTLQQKRQALADLGISESTINALLRDQRLGNQGGGDLTSAYNKVVDGLLATLTPDEIQAYGDATAVTTFSDDQAQRIADFLAARSLNTSAQLKAYLDDNTNPVPSQIDVTALTGVFVTFDPKGVVDKLP